MRAQTVNILRNSFLVCGSLKYGLAVIYFPDIKEE